MKFVSRLVVLLLIILLFSACNSNVKDTRGIERNLELESNSAETTPTDNLDNFSNINKLGLAKSKSKVFGVGDDDFELSVETVDMNSDGKPDTVTIVSIPPNKEKFRLIIQLSDNGIVSQELEGNIWAETSFYCVDVTGDAIPEIVFPNFFYSSTADENYSAIYRLENNTIREIPLFNDHEQSRQENSYKWDVGTLEIRTINSFEYEIYNQLSAHIYQIDIYDYRTSQYEVQGLTEEEIHIWSTNQYVISSWLVPIDNIQFGFRLNRFLELYLTTGNTHDVEPSATIVVSSLVKWDGQNWILVDEMVYSVDKYYLESESYWKSLR